MPLWMARRTQDVWGRRRPPLTVGMGRKRKRPLWLEHSGERDAWREGRAEGSLETGSAAVKECGLQPGRGHTERARGPVGSGGGRPWGVRERAPWGQRRPAEDQPTEGTRSQGSRRNRAQGWSLSRGGVVPSHSLGRRCPIW